MNDEELIERLDNIETKITESQIENMNSKWKILSMIRLYYDLTVGSVWIAVSWTVTFPYKIVLIILGIIFFWLGFNELRYNERKF